MSASHAEGHADVERIPALFLLRDSQWQNRRGSLVSVT